MWPMYGTYLATLLGLALMDEILHSNMKKINSILENRHLKEEKIPYTMVMEHILLS